MDTEHAGHEEPAIVASLPTRGEAEVVEAKLRAYGIEATLEDLIEGGAIPVEGEPGVNVVVRAADVQDARRILAPEDATLGTVGEQAPEVS
jgi:hypothetical protein